MVHQNENKSSLLVFIDADAFVALVRSDDDNHKKALELYDKLSKREVKFSTSTYVFSEAVTVISQRVGHQVAVEFIDEMKRSGSAMDIKWIEPEDEAAAIAIFKKQTSKNVSFVDCTNMALINRYSLDCIFSFDKGYRTNQFKTVEDYI